MFCKNCGKEIGNSRECSYCGYDPIKDDDPNFELNNSSSNIVVPPVKITPIKKRNGLATAGFVLSFFSCYFVPFGLLSIIFGFIGLSKSKLCRTGKAKSIIAILMSAAWGVLWGLYIYASISGKL